MTIKRKFYPRLLVFDWHNYRVNHRITVGICMIDILSAASSRPHGSSMPLLLPTLQFYFYILAVSSALLCVYILCNTYNLIWIICPQLGTMYRIIKRYQVRIDDGNSDIYVTRIRSAIPLVIPSHLIISTLTFEGRGKGRKSSLALMVDAFNFGTSVPCRNTWRGRFTSGERAFALPRTSPRTTSSPSTSTAGTRT